jgi:hypothetical protein
MDHAANLPILILIQQLCVFEKEEEGACGAAGAAGGKMSVFCPFSGARAQPLAAV